MQREPQETGKRRNAGFERGMSPPRCLLDVTTPTIAAIAELNAAFNSRPLYQQVEQHQETLFSRGGETLQAVGRSVCRSVGPLVITQYNCISIYARILGFIRSRISKYIFSFSLPATKKKRVRLHKHSLMITDQPNHRPTHRQRSLPSFRVALSKLDIENLIDQKVE